MATPIVMPSFGMYTNEGTLVNWLHANGTQVKQGEPILEIETEKAVNPVISPADGFLCHIVKVGTLIREQGLLGYVLADGETAPAARSASPQSPILKNANVSEAANDAKPGEGRVKASPAARKLARELQVDLAKVTGSGPGGRIVEADIQASARQTAQPSSTASVFTKDGQGAPLSAMRRTIGERLRWSLNNAVSLTITREVEADNLVNARKVLSERLKVSVSYDALFVKLLAAALREHPALNVVIENDCLLAFDTIDICFAVAVPAGLAVPVVRNADKTALVEMVGQMRWLGEQARSNALRSEDLSGGCSTVTNLGADGVDVFTPILNPPQPTILGVGRIADRPVVKNSALVVARTCWLSLTFDHRVTDGVPAAKVLESIAKRMTDPDYLYSLA